MSVTISNDEDEITFSEPSKEADLVWPFNDYDVSPRDSRILAIRYDSENVPRVPKPVFETRSVNVIFNWNARSPSGSVVTKQRSE